MNRDADGRGNDHVQGTRLEFNSNGVCIKHRPVDQVAADHRSQACSRREVLSIQYILVIAVKDKGIAPIDPCSTHSIHQLFTGIISPDFQLGGDF